MPAKKKPEVLMYKGKPLLRCGDLIYYGNPEDKLFVCFRMEDNEPLDDLTVSRKVIIEREVPPFEASRERRTV